MTLIIAPSSWSRMWQWNIQSPGLSATNAISARSRGGISTVSRHSRYFVRAPLRVITRNECAEEPIDVYDSIVIVAVTFPAHALDRIHELAFTVIAQACTKAICLPPDEIAGRAAW